MSKCNCADCSRFRRLNKIMADYKMSKEDVGFLNSIWEGILSAETDAEMANFRLSKFQTEINYLIDVEKQEGRL